MINSLIRSPAFYFDKTSIATLNNKLSNDLGYMDKMLF